MVKVKRDFDLKQQFYDLEVKREKTQADLVYTLCRHGSDAASKCTYTYYPQVEQIRQ